MPVVLVPINHARQDPTCLHVHTRVYKITGWISFNALHMCLGYAQFQSMSSHMLS